MMTPTFNSQYQGFMINTNKDAGNSCAEEILNQYHNQLTYMLEKHCRVIQIRFDLHYPLDGSVIPTRKHLYYFRNNLIRKIERDYPVGCAHSPDPQFTWAQEQASSLHSHYHCVLLLNGSIYRCYFTFLQEIVLPIWMKVLNTNNAGIVDFCDKFGPNGLTMDRNLPDYQQKIQDCFYQFSYIAKIRDKNQRPKGCWHFGGTRNPYQS